MEAPEIKPKAPLLNQVISGQAPGKINLILRIPGRLENGYHLIESIIAPLSLVDDINLKVVPVVRNARAELSVRCEFSPELQAHIQCVSKSDPRTGAIVQSLSSSENIVIRAAEAFLRSVGKLGQFGVHLEIYKRIPFGAGLGGGSADAATTLSLLNSAFHNPLSEIELSKLGAEIGSDVAALITPGLSFVLGTGGRVLKCSTIGNVGGGEIEGREEGCGVGEFDEFLALTELLIVKPPITVPTELAYSSLGLPRNLPNSDALRHFPSKESGIWSDLRALSLGFSEASTVTEDGAKAREMLTFFEVEGSSGGLDSVSDTPPMGRTAGESLTRFDRICRTLRNDFEETIFGQFSEIRLAREILESSGVVYTLLAGSGSSVVGFVRDAFQASEVEETLRTLVPTGWFVVKCSLKNLGR